MEQHPIPQQISSYQFKLVGDMTLKQFFQVAGGALVGLLFYSTGLHPLIKWPLILISTGLGAAMAFLPFEERPLEKWIIAFFRSIYTPTLYKWKRYTKNPVYFTEDGQTPNIGAVPVNGISDKNTKSLEEAEKSFLGKVTSMWQVANQPATINRQTTPVQQPIPPNPFAVQQQRQVAAPQPKSSTAIDPLKIPKQTPTAIPRVAPKLVVEERPKAPQSGVDIKSEDISTSATNSSQISSQKVEFSIDAAPPHPPTMANTIVGQVIDQDRKIISGAIMEIRDSQGRPVRALKSNMAGHFIIVTPLLNGRYEINTEKEGYKFEPVTFETEGDIIPPIAIRGIKQA